jgi:hypothetical protein
MIPAMRRGTLSLLPLLLVLLQIGAGGALAQTQTTDASAAVPDRGGLALRELTVSSGYGAVQLPPITLGGYLPNDVFQNDLVTSASAAIDWRHNGRRTSYALDLFGAYTARERFSELNAPAANFTFGVTRTFGTRWRVSTGVASAIVSSQQAVPQPTQTRQLVDNAQSFDDLAGTVALAHSPSPDLAAAAQFLPVSQSLDTGDLPGNRGLISSASASLAYAQSTRFTTHVDAGYTKVRQWFTKPIPAQSLLNLNSTAEFAGLGFRYDRSPRSQFTTDVSWSKTEGVAIDEIVSATIGYGWTGRKWFMRTTVGEAIRPFSGTTQHKEPVIIYSGALGYKFASQTLLAQYTRAPHDEMGDGGRNAVTGFSGDMQAVTAAWLWSPTRSRWTAQSDFSLTRRPGNFSYTFAWLATGGFGRQFGSHVRIMGELLYDRHGSRGFEGFALSRQEARLTFIWTLPRHPLGSS